MRRVLNFLINKWVLSFIGVLALAIVVWFGADYIKFGENNDTLSSATRLIIIIVLLFIWVIWRLVSWGLENKQNNDLLDGIEEAEAEAAAANPDQERTSEELSQISGRFRDALGVLRQSRFKATGNSKALYQLPWYIIIGPPGSGKTTALVNSGLDFPLAQSLGKESLGGIGGTRNCDWWFTNEAVMIDTAGRYTTQDSHRVVDNAAWHGFLDLLKKYRRRRPINGVIVAISLQDLMVQTAEQRQHHAKTIRTRIDELQERLGIHFPIYLMFTKCDLVAGFSEFFSNLSQAEREQVWGTTFPIVKPGNAIPLEEFSQRFSDMIVRLNQRLIWRIHNERSLEARTKMQGFPDRMDSLNDVIGDFLKQTFSVNKYNAAPMLRGVYFTSGTQEGTPIDRMMASVSANFGLPREVNQQQQGMGKSFFISRLLKDIIFPESELVGVNRKLESLMLWGRRASFGTLGVASIAAIVIWAGSITRNNMYMSEVNDSATEFEKQSRDLRPSDPNTLRTLPALAALHKGSTIYDQDDHPWLKGLGLYDGNVDVAAKGLYQEKLKEYFLPSYINSIERKLGRMTVNDPSLLDTLRVYLMLHDKDRRDLDEIKAWSESEWQKDLPGQADKQEELSMHLGNLFTEELPVLKPNQRVVERAQRELRRIPVSQRLYTQLKYNSNQKIDLFSQIGGDSEQVFGISPSSPVYSADYLFTKDGFESADYGASSPLMEQIADDQWIYGSADGEESYSMADREKFSTEIERAYLNEYSRYWRNFLSKFNIAKFRDIDTAVDNLRQLSDPTYSPLLSVLETASDNTKLRPEINADALGKAGDAKINAGRLGQVNVGDALQGAAAHTRKPTSVDNEFRELHRMVTSVRNRPAPIQEILASINGLQEMMSDIASSGNPGKAAFNVAKARFAGGGNDAIKQIRRKALNAPEPLKGWLEDISSNSWQLILDNAKGHINQVWEEEVNRVYQSRIAGRFPFGSSANDDVALADFKRYFGPDGVERNFINQYLRPFINTRKWTSKTLENKGIYLSDDARVQLLRAQQIRNIFFPGGDAVAPIDLTFRQRKLNDNFEEFSLDLGTPGKNLEFRHGPAIPKSTRWKMGVHDRARVLVKYLGEDSNADIKASYNGEWAWMRLFEATKMQRNSDSSLKTVFSVDGHNAEFKLIAKTSAGKFNPRLLRIYRNPASL